MTNSTLEERQWEYFAGQRESDDGYHRRVSAHENLNEKYGNVTTKKRNVKLNKTEKKNILNYASSKISHDNSCVAFFNCFPFSFSNDERVAFFIILETYVKTLVYGRYRGSKLHSFVRCLLNRSMHIVLSCIESYKTQCN